MAAATDTVTEDGTVVLAHARKFGPSSSSRWMNCPGSLKACEGLPNLESEFAREGSVAHALAELAQKNNRHPAEYIGHVFPEWPEFKVDYDMASFVWEYIQHFNSYDGVTHRMTEIKVPLGQFFGLEEDGDGQDAFGTADNILLRDEGRHLIVGDLKYGFKIVSAIKNTQALSYAGGALDVLSPFFPNIERITVVIAQPRQNHIDEWDCTLEDLAEFQQDAKDAIARVEQFPDLRIPGEQCHYCDARLRCPERIIGMMSLVLPGLDGDDMSEVKVIAGPQEARAAGLPVIDRERRLAILRNHDAIKRVLADIYGDFETELLQGKEVEGHKAVMSKTNRKVDNPRVFARYARINYGLTEEQLFKPAQLQNLTTLEKLIPKTAPVFNLERGVTTKPPGRLVMVPEKDPRKAVEIEPVEAGFDELVDEVIDDVIF